MRIEIITPDATVFDSEADAITLPTADGEVTILPGHIPLIGVVVPGTMVVLNKGTRGLYAVSRGILEVDGKGVRVLAQTADRAEELEERVILTAKAEAERVISEKRHDLEAYTEATAILERELAKLNVVRRHRSVRGMPHGES